MIVVQFCSPFPPSLCTSRMCRNELCYTICHLCDSFHSWRLNMNLKKQDIIGSYIPLSLQHRKLSYGDLHVFAVVFQVLLFTSTGK